MHAAKARNSGATALISACLFACLTACSPGTGATSFQPALSSARADHGFNFVALANASCANAEQPTEFQDITIEATALSSAGKRGARLDGATFFGGWVLKSSEPNFGGLSGLAYHDDGLLAVSDAGAFVQIGLSNGVPTGLGGIGYMLGTDGRLLDGKREADAEGLSLAGEVALVSFEREHRVLAFGLGQCGLAARGVEVSKIAERPLGAGRNIPNNRGAEGLTLDANGKLLVGIEAPDGNRAILGELTSRRQDFSRRILRAGNGQLTGLDFAQGKLFALYREFSPLFGNRASIYAFEDGIGAPEKLALLRRPFPVDNFEGITALPRPDGGLRLYMIADNNFNPVQRTLLLAFDIEAEAETP